MQEVCFKVKNICKKSENFFVVRDFSNKKLSRPDQYIFVQVYTKIIVGQSLNICTCYHVNFFKCLLRSGFPIGQTSQVSTYQRETRGGSLYKSTFHLINRNTHTHVNTYICVQVWYGGGDKGRPNTGTGGSSPSSMVCDLAMAMIKMMMKTMILKTFCIRYPPLCDANQAAEVRLPSRFTTHDLRCFEKRFW